MGTEAPGGWWDRTGWPVLMGTIIAVGTFAAYLDIGLLGCLITLLFMELSVGPAGWLLLAEVGKPGLRAVLELGPAFAVALLTVMGLTWSLGVWAVLPGLVAALSSPLLRAPARRALVRRYGSDRAEMRRQFEGIVAHSLADPGADSSDPGEAGRR